MLEIRSACENCGNALPPDSTQAMICTFECTFCAACVNEILHNVCPNCGGGFERRPVRPKEKLFKYPAKKDLFVRPVNLEKFADLLQANQGIQPSER